MTLFLASVRDAEEAELALKADADIVDLKDPGRGALGAVAPDTIAACVKRVAGRATVSATVGDIALGDEAVGAAVLAAAALGVNYVKLGLFPDGDADGGLNRLEEVAAQTRLVVVLFADALPAFDAIALAAKIGAHGVMFDTMGKDARSLPDHLSYMTLATHIAAAKAEGLVVGLAGSLKARHVPSLLALSPDLLGFRGALCHGGDRARTLDPDRLRAIRALIPSTPRILHDAKVPDLSSHALC